MTQRLRLGAGLVLLVYVTTHLLNHTLGLVSLETAELGRQWFAAFWHLPPLTLLLYGSLVTHITLALWTLYRRRTLRLPAWEILRLSLGLAIPLHLLAHVFGTRVAYEAFGVPNTYSRLVLNLWVQNPVGAVLQIALLLAAWAHGWLGLYYWLRARPRHPLLWPTLRAVGLLVPLLAILGFADMGREVAALARDPAWVQTVSPPPPPLEPVVIDTWRDRTLGLFLGAVALALAGRWLRGAWQRQRGDLIAITYPAGRKVAVVPGTTILEASRLADIPHASLCGGRGRCSTCRTRIGAGLEALPPPSADEARVLRRIGAPPNVRLACQTRPTADVDVFPLLPPYIGSARDVRRTSDAGGAEREIAVLFADMRAFTRFSERRLPYDVVFVLNQWNDALGHAIERAGGQPNQFVGDGIMALFGVSGTPAAGCRAALHGALNMAQAVENLNRMLAHDLHEPLRIGIGIHMGQVIVGEMGYGRARYFTAIGDVVNTASRLEALTKDYGCQLIVSEEVAQAAGVDLSGFPSEEAQVRGRTQPLRIRMIGSALDLAGRLPAADASLAGSVAQRSGQRT